MKDKGFIKNDSRKHFISFRWIYSREYFITNREEVMLNNGLFTSNTDLWSTPQDFFDKLNKQFNFTLDPCATDDNHKCIKYFTKEDDGLSKDWSNERVFMNPPYGREIGKWVKKASEQQGGMRVFATS